MHLNNCRQKQQSTVLDVQGQRNVRIEQSRACSRVMIMTSVNAGVLRQRYKEQVRAQEMPAFRNPILSRHT